MDYNRLHLFNIVAELGSITDAASSLYRTQSAVTQQIQKLETEFNTQLFERSGRKIILTPDGKRIYEETRNYFLIINDRVSEILKRDDIIEGQLRVGILQDEATQFSLGTALSIFSKKYPKVTITIIYGTNHEIESALLNGEIDIGILVIFKHREMFRRSEVCSATHMLVTSPGYIKRYGSIESVDSLLLADLLDFSDTYPCLSPWIKKNFPTMMGTLSHRHPKISAPNHRDLKQLILEGCGVGILPKHLISKELKSKSIIEAMPNTKSLQVGLDIAVRTSHKLRPHETKFWNHVTEGD